MKTNGNLTIYNKYFDPITRNEKYQRSQVIGIMWQNRKAINIIMSGGNIESDQATIFIPFSHGIHYLDPKEWEQSKAGNWTLKVGDCIVRGLVSDEIANTVTDPITNVVTPAFTISSLKAKYDNVLVITSVDSDDQGSPAMQHWEVGAK